jgi:hypothetical protein
MASMDYVVDTGSPARLVRDVGHFSRMVGGDNELVRRMRERGYRYIHFASGYEQTTLCSGVEDLCILGTSDALDEIGLVLLRRTPLVDVGLAVLPLSAKLAGRMTFNWRGFDALEEHLGEVRGQRKPLLLYAHILDPHPPLRHNADCSMRPSAPDLMQWSVAQRPAFVEEIKCVNTQLMRVIHEILADDPDAILVVNSDHGSAFRQQFGNAPDAWSAEDIRERFATLLAMRVPVACRGRAEGLKSLVNVFRVVEGCLTGTDIPLLPHRRFITPYSDDPNFGKVFAVRAPVDAPAT